MEDYKIFILKTIQEAGTYLEERSHGVFSVGHKGTDPRDVITDVDRELNTFITDAIKNHFPDHRIHSEEGTQDMGAGYVWVVDPIDGTSNFARGIPHFAVCIGLLKDGVPLLGAVYNPITRELYHADETGSYRNDEKITVTSEVSLSNATVLLHIGRTETVRSWGLSLQEKFLTSAKKTINLGSSALDLCYLASGRVDGVIYGTMSLRDVASAALIVRTAGGEIYNYDTGSPAELLAEPQKIIATATPELRDEIVG